MQHCALVQAQQVAHGGRCGQGAGRAGCVEHFVVRAAKELTRADSHLVSGDAGRQQLPAACADSLCHGKRGREDDGSRMEDGAVVHIVLLCDM